MDKMDAYITTYTNDPKPMLVRLKNFGEFLQQKNTDSFLYRLSNIRQLLPQNCVDNQVDFVADCITAKYSHSWFQGMNRGKVLEAVCNRYVADYFKL
jgi:hypothetical protein